MMANLNDRCQIAKANATVIRSRRAAGLQGFDKGAARKYRPDPNGLIPKAYGRPQRGAAAQWRRRLALALRLVSSAAISLPQLVDPVDDGWSQRLQVFLDGSTRSELHRVDELLVLGLAVPRGASCGHRSLMRPGERVPALAHGSRWMVAW